MDIAEIGALIGDRTRARMLAALMSGRALTATELATIADISASTASAHLARLTSGRLLRRTAQGRHRYFKLASPTVAAMLETLLVVAAQPGGERPRAPRIDPRLREARACYDHLAGRLGVDLMCWSRGGPFASMRTQARSRRPALSSWSRSAWSCQTRHALRDGHVSRGWTGPSDVLTSRARSARRSLSASSRSVGCSAPPRVVLSP